MAMPPFVRPMLARSGAVPDNQDKWSAEVKWDGYRCGAYCRSGDVELVSRNRITMTDSFPEITGIGEQVGSEDLILDGEIVAFDEQGLPSFELLQGIFRRNRSGSADSRGAPPAGVVFVVFDLLYHGDREITALPYLERRERLESLNLSGPSWQTPERLEGDHHELLEATRAQGMEGLVLKRDDGHYDPGRRSGAWVKVKNVRSAELVIGGWLPGEGSREGSVGAILIGAWEDAGGDQSNGGHSDGESSSGRNLRYMGRVGTGFGSTVADHLRMKLQERERPDSPFALLPRGIPRAVRHVDPTLVADVEYREITRDGYLRHPVFRGLRFDKGPRETDPAEELVPSAEQHD